MLNGVLRRIACVGAMVGLGVASSPRIPAASAAPVAAATAGPNHAALPATTASARAASEAGRGWGSMIACAACLLAAGVVVAGGPAGIIAAVNTPGSAIAVMACAAACYEAFQ
jgi:hypothetical protein